MTPIETILAFTILIAGTGFYFWIMRYLKKKVAEANKTEEYNRNRAAVGAIIYSVVGLVLLGSILFQWNQIPSENIGLAIGFIALATGMILFGVYRWFRGRRSV